MQIRIYIIFLLILLTLSSNAQDTRVGIITDFSKSVNLDSLFREMATEIDKTVGSSKNVTLAFSDVIYNVETLSQASETYKKQAGKVDLILLVGSISVKGAIQDSNYPIPTIGIGVVDPYLQNLPYVNGASGEDNFSYIWRDTDVLSEFKEFRKLFPFNNLTILTNTDAASTVDLARVKIMTDSLSRSLETNINIVTIEPPYSDLSSIPEETDAVYMADLINSSPAEINDLANGLIERKLPSLSSIGSHVKQGVLASSADEKNLSQIIRKVSIMADDALQGNSLANVSVALNAKSRFSLNLQTARALDLYPSFDVLFTAKLIDKNNHNLNAYSLSEVLSKSMETNFDIKISYRDIELTEQDIRSARSSVLPSLDANVTALKLNPDQSNVFSPEEQAQAQLALNQVIFSEQAIASIKVANLLKSAQEYQTEAEILGILFDTYNGYFNVLAAKTDLLIKRENLTNSKINLELARTKVEVGSASKADVYRWESEVAIAMQQVVNSETNLLSSKIQLNTLLANTLESDFEIDDVTLDGELFKSFSEDLVAEFIQTPRDFEKIADFLVDESLNANPNKKVLLENIKVVERQRQQNQRLLYAPVLAVQAQAGRFLYTGGVGSEPTEGFTLPENQWQVGLSLTHPIFQGFSRKATLQKTIIQRDQLAYSEQQLDQQLELQVRTSLLTALNASTNISFSKIASDNALSNFELVQNGYKEGRVIITQLIDAQEAALNAQLNYSLSIYDFVQAKLQVEFALGFFSMLQTEEEKQDFTARFTEYLNAN